MTNNVESLKCFIITPIGSERSEVRDSLDGLMQNVIEPVLKEIGFNTDNIFVAHQIHESGSINNQIINHIVEDDINIVNLTGLNPNVMYELAVRHSVGKPVIIIAEEGTKLPFDIVDQRTIFYKDTMLGAVLLKEKLSKVIKLILENPENNIDNPVLKIVKENSVIQEVKNSPSNGDGIGLILNKIFELERSINNLNNSRIHSSNKKSNFKNLYNNNDFLVYSLVLDGEYDNSQYKSLKDLLMNKVDTNKLEKIFINKEGNSIDLFFSEILSSLTEAYIINSVEQNGYKVKGIYPNV